MFFFASKEENSNNNFKDNSGINNPPKKKSNWSAPKTNSSELETFFLKEIHSAILKLMMSKKTFLEKKEAI